MFRFPSANHGPIDRRLAEYGAGFLEHGWRKRAKQLSCRRLSAFAAAHGGAMAISSMTGFARSEGVHDGASWVWELRSVNGRGLDIRLRLPPGSDALELPARDAIAQRFVRGNVSATLTLERGAGLSSVRLNEAVLQDVLRAADRVCEFTGGPRPTPAEVLAIKGVLEVSEATAEPVAVRDARHAVLLKGLELAIERLAEARRGEGLRLQSTVEAQIAEIESLTNRVRAAPSRGVDAIRQRVAELVGRIADGSDKLDAGRLHQEAMLIATRADVEEELTRLDAHVAAAREMLHAGIPIGRKLDFLSQEFNREANTLCSKAMAVDVTRDGLALKAVIDQFREQIQNIE
jgi:uncharacterized protein (TIGR00255 family)